MQILRKRTCSMIQLALGDCIRARHGLVRLAISKEEDEIVDRCSVMYLIFCEEVLSGKVQTSRRVGPALFVLAAQTLQFSLHLQTQGARISNAEMVQTSMKCNNA